MFSFCASSSRMHPPLKLRGYCISFCISYQYIYEMFAVVIHLLDVLAVYMKNFRTFHISTSSLIHDFFPLCMLLVSSPNSLGSKYLLSLQLLTDQDGGVDLKNFNDKTPYTIMFGPDKCGNDYKLHFIFRHVNPLNGEIEEKHAKATVCNFVMRFRKMCFWITECEEWV